MPKRRFDVDRKDLIILGGVREKPEATLKELEGYIEEVVGKDEAIPYATLQKRVQNLLDQRALIRQIIAEPAAFGYIIHGRIDVFINPIELRKRLKPHMAKTQKELAEYIVNTLVGKDPRFKDDIHVQDIYILLGGNADLSIDVFAMSYEKLSEFVLEGVRELPGIGNTQTAILSWSVKRGNL